MWYMKTNITIEVDLRKSSKALGAFILHRTTSQYQLFATHCF